MGIVEPDQTLVAFAIMQCQRILDAMWALRIDCNPMHLKLHPISLVIDDVNVTIEA
jgi:hypothetical protein